MTHAGVPGVVQVWCHEAGGARTLHGICDQAALSGARGAGRHVAAQCGGSAYASKYIVVVDDDVDVTNLEQLIWAMPRAPIPRSRSSSSRAHGIRRPIRALPPEKRAAGDMTHSVADHQRLQAVALARQVPAVQHAERRDARKAREKFGWLLEGK